MLNAKVRYELLVVIVMGWLMFAWASFNAMGMTSTNSDVFWAMFGLTAAIEAGIEIWFDGNE